MICLVCKNPVTDPGGDLLPAHDECFDSFENAEAYEAYVRTELVKELADQLTAHVFCLKNGLKPKNFTYVDEILKTVLRGVK